MPAKTECTTIRSTKDYQVRQRESHVISVYRYELTVLCEKHYNMKFVTSDEFTPRHRRHTLETFPDGSNPILSRKLL